MKQRTTMTALLLTLLILLLTPMAAHAGTPGTVEQLTQDVYGRVALMTTESYPEVCIPPTHSSASTATGARSLSFERVLNTTEGINKPVRLHLYLAAEDGCAWTDFEGMLASLVNVMSDLQVHEGQAVRSYRAEAAYPPPRCPPRKKHPPRLRRRRQAAPALPSATGCAGA